METGLMGEVLTPELQETLDAGGQTEATTPSMTIEAHVVHFQRAHQLGEKALQIGYDLTVPAFGGVARPGVEIL